MYTHCLLWSRSRLIPNAQRLVVILFGLLDCLLFASIFAHYSHGMWFVCNIILLPFVTFIKSKQISACQANAHFRHSQRFCKLMVAVRSIEQYLLLRTLWDTYNEKFEECNARVVETYEISKVNLSGLDAEPDDHYKDWECIRNFMWQWNLFNGISQSLYPIAMSLEKRWWSDTLSVFILLDRTIE